MVEKRPDRKGRKERDQGLEKDDIGSKKLTVLTKDGDASASDPAQWARLIAEGSHEDLLTAHLEGVRRPKNSCFVSSASRHENLYWTLHSRQSPGKLSQMKDSTQKTWMTCLALMPWYT